MIFVTVGTHDQGFERLVKKMDEIAGQIDEKVVIQLGYTDYEPKNAEWFRFKEYENILKIIEESDLVVCHGGAGILLDVIGKKKQVIVVPRLKEFNEVYDNHEFELAEALNKSKKIKLISKISHLDQSTINNKYEKPFKTKKSILITDFLEKCLDETKK